MRTVRILLTAFFCALVPSLVATAGSTTSLKSAAPVDEYFGKQRMSAIGIRMRIDSLGRAYHARSKSDDDLLHDAQIVEESLRVWNARYPKDSWLAPTAFHLEQLYAVIQTNEARAHAATMLRFVTDNFASTRYGHLSRLRLAQGFPALQQESAVAAGSATPDPSSSNLPTLSPVASPVASPLASPVTTPAASATHSGRP